MNGCETKALRTDTFTACSPNCRRCWATSPRSRSAVPRRRSPPATITDRTDWWDYILSLPSPRVVVVQDMCQQGRPGFAAGRGACQHPPRARLRGRGDQWLRARPAQRLKSWDSTFTPAASRSPTPTFILLNSERRWRLADCGFNPATCSMATCMESKPSRRTLPTKFRRAAAEIVAREQELIALCQSKDFSVEKLRAAVARRPFLRPTTTS